MSNPSCYYPSHVFPCHASMRLCWTSSNDTELTHQSPSIVIDHNHALTPIQYDVPMLMQCNAPLHVISYHIYHEYYMDNSNHTIHHVLWTIISKAYNFQITLIPMSLYILALIYQHLINNYHQTCYNLDIKQSSILSQDCP